MDPIEHAKILARGALPETDLHDLGRVNVICGKNNSGKSTLLAGICVAEPIRGVRITERCEEGAWNSVVAAGDLGGRATPIQNEMRKAMRSTLDAANRGVWFANQGGVFANEMQAALGFANPNFGTWNSGRAMQQFLNLFPALPSRVLVPAKRELSTATNITAGQPIASNGGGILNRLFLLRNQRPGSHGQNLLSAIREAFTHISDGYDFFIEQRADDGQLHLHFALDGSTWRHADTCGLGLQDLLVLLFFAHDPTYEVIGIEEPETHMHPDMQRRFLTHLRTETAKQYFLTTHSNVFLSPPRVDQVIFTVLAATSDSVTVTDVSKRAKILSDLGYSASDNLSPDLVLLVEGPNDKPIYECLLEQFGLAAKFDVRIWPLGGDRMDKSDLAAFGAQGRLLAVLDLDPESADVRSRFTAKCKDLGIPTFTLERYAIENYFPLSAFQTVFRQEMPASVSAIAPDVSIRKQLGFNVKRRNRELVEATDAEHWKSTDLSKLMELVRLTCES